MAKMVNYNGFIARLDPEMEYYRPNEEYTKGWNGYHYIFKVYGVYYLLVTGYSDGRQVRVDYTVTPNMLHIAYCQATYKLNTYGNWVKISNFPTNTHLWPIDDVEIIYADQALYYLELGNSGIWPSKYCEESPIAYIVTEYPALPTVEAYGWNKGGDIKLDIPKAINCNIAQITTAQEILWSSLIQNICNATVSDGGTVIVEWYRNNKLYSVSENIGSTQTSFKPLVKETGTSTWYAIVINKKDDQFRVKTLNSFTITVVDWNLEDNIPINKTSVKIEENSYKKKIDEEIIKTGFEEFRFLSKNPIKDQIFIFLVDDNYELQPLKLLLRK